MKDNNLIRTKFSLYPAISGTENFTIGLRPFLRQDSIAKSLVKNLIVKGGLPISIVETNWFRAFITDTVHMFNIPMSRTVWEMLEKMGND